MIKNDAAVDEAKSPLAQGAKELTKNRSMNRSMKLTGDEQETKRDFTGNRCLVQKREN